MAITRVLRTQQRWGWVAAPCGEAWGPPALRSAGEASPVSPLPHQKDTVDIKKKKVVK